MELIKESEKKLSMCFLRIGSTQSGITRLQLPMFFGLPKNIKWIRSNATVQNNTAILVLKMKLLGLDASAEADAWSRGKPKW